MKTAIETEFKETEIGTIPEEWNVSTLESISLDVTDGSHFSPKESPQGNRIIAMVKDMRYNKFSFEGSKRILAEDFERLVKDGCSPKKGDILISKDGANCLDLIFVYNQEEKIVILSSIAIVRLKPNLNPQFYRYYLLSPIAQQIMRLGYVSGSAIPRVVLKDLKKIPVPTLGVEEQNRIASILWSLDEKIELNQQMNKTLEAVGKAIFRHWFVDFEFLNEEGKPYKSSGGEMTHDEEYGREIPDGWHVRRLEEVTEVIFSGGTPDTSQRDYWDGQFSWLSSGETRNNFIVRTEKTITEKGVENSSTRLAKVGDVVIASAGQGGTRGQTSLCLLDTYINQSLVALRRKEGIMHTSYLFLNLFLRYPELRAISDSHSIRGSLTTRDLKDLTILVPPLKYLDSFDSLFSSVAKQIRSNLIENQALSQIRDSLLPKLVSGKIRVPVEVR